MKTSFAMLLAALSLPLLGCEVETIGGYGCVDKYNHGAPCPKELMREVCKGECLTMGTAGFRREPLLLWVGDVGSPAPACPDHAKSEWYNGNSGLITQPYCPLCTCGISTCQMPIGISASVDSLCQGLDYTPLLAPEGWDGSCVSPASLPPGSFAAVSIGPPSAGACEIVEVPPPANAADDYLWTKAYRACDGLVSGVCSSSDQMCSPTAKPPPPGFRSCIAYEDVVDETDLPTCPKAYPEQEIAYGDVDDQRKCSPCDCGPPLGTQCVAAVSAYQDPTCGTTMFPLFENYAIGLGQTPACLATMAGAALGSMSATWAVNSPGACVPSGGIPYGEAKPSKPRVFCCQPPPIE